MGPVGEADWPFVFPRGRRRRIIAEPCDTPARVILTTDGSDSHEEIALEAQAATSTGMIAAVHKLTEQAIRQFEAATPNVGGDS